MLVTINTRPAIVVGSRLGGLDRCVPFHAEVKPRVGLMNPLRLLSPRDTDRKPGGFYRCLEPNISILFWLHWSERGGADGSISGCNSDVNPTELKSRAAPALLELRSVVRTASHDLLHNPNDKWHSSKYQFKAQLDHR